LIRPNSRGRITLRSSNPLDAPLIHANYFADPRDTQAVVEGKRQRKHVVDRLNPQPV